MKEFEFFDAANEGRLHSAQRLEATADPALSEDTKGWSRRWQPFDFNLTEVHVLEEVADQPTRVFRDHDFVRASDGLQPRCKVWRLANDGLLLPSLVSRLLTMLSRAPARLLPADRQDQATTTWKKSSEPTPCR